MIFVIVIILDIFCCCFALDAIGRKNRYDICNKKNKKDETEETHDLGNPKRPVGVSV